MAASKIEWNRFLSDLPDVPTPSTPVSEELPPPPHYTFGDLHPNALSRQTSVSHHQSPAPRITRESNRRPGKSRFVIGIDYGTTYTGLAFATTKSDKADLNDIEVLVNWTATMNSQEKVRTMLSYGIPGQPQWGTDVSKDAVTMINTKLDLGPRESRLDELESTWHLLEGTKGLSFAHVQECGPEPAFTHKSPTQIVTDYLTKIRECACRSENIDLKHLSTTKTPVDIVVTVPVNWPYEAKNATFQALRAAGFTRKTFPTLEDTIMVSEPEAASYFTARDRLENGDDFLEEEQCFVLCDAGGGTVDVVSLQVTQAGLDLKLQKATDPKSASCGSVFIDTAFKRWLLRIIGPEKYTQLDPYYSGNKIYAHSPESGEMRELIKRFEVQKKLFSRSTRDVKIDLPGPLSGLDIVGRVREGELTIKRKEMEAMFLYCVNEIIALIDAQINQVRDVQHRRVKNVFLVGGFGTSPYLQEVLRDSLQLRKPKIALRLPDTKSWTAVVRGAVIYGIEKSLHPDFETTSAIINSYGFSVSKISAEEWRFEWVIRKGDLVLRHEKRIATSKPFYSNVDKGNSKGRYSLQIYSFHTKDDEDEGPEWWVDGQKEVKKVLQVDYDISKIPGRGGGSAYPLVGGWVGPLTCQMEICGTTMEVKILSGESVIGRATTQVEVDVPSRPRTNNPWGLGEEI